MIKMEKDLIDVLGESSSMALEKIVLIFDKANMSVEKIADQIINLPDNYRAGIYVIAISLNKLELAQKIRKAIILIEKLKIVKFKEAVDQGYGREYLKTLSLEDKISLKVNMNLFRTGEPGEKLLTNIEQMYLDLIDESIKEEFGKKL